MVSIKDAVIYHLEKKIVQLIKNCLQIFNVVIQ